MHNGNPNPMRFHFIILTIIFQSSGLILGKYAAQSIPHFTIGALLGSPFYIASLVCLILQALVWQQALKRYALSIAYPFMSLTNFIALFAGGYLFNEGISILNVIGLVLITIGIFFVAGEMKQ